MNAFGTRPYARQRKRAATSHALLQSQRLEARWSLRKCLLNVTLTPLLVTFIGLAACSSPANLQVSYGEWEAFGQGKPGPESIDTVSVGQTVRDGTGPSIAQGDLIELRMITRKGSRDGRAPSDHAGGVGWTWIGFDGVTASVFPGGQRPFAAALIGLRQGSVHTFTVGPQARVKWAAGGAGQMPFGDPQNFLFLGPLALEARTRGGTPVYADRGSVEDMSLVEITRVCKGRAEQRLITLFDNTPIRLAQDLGRTHETTAPRWRYVREARWEGQCNDGKHASYQHGPIIVEPPPGMSRGLNISQLWDTWIKDAWTKVPIGVVVR